MAKPPSDFNVANGLMGIGHDMMIQIMHEMTSIRDVQNFLGLTKQTKNLVSHTQFHWSTETALADKTGTKAIICQRLPHAAICVKPERTAEDDEKINGAIYTFDVTKDRQLKVRDEQRIKQLTVQYKNVKVDDNSSFFVFCIIYIDGLGVLRKHLIEFDNLKHETERPAKDKEWFDSIQMPPETVKFVRVKSGGNFTVAQDEAGNLWSRGWTEDGKFTEEEKFTILKHFKVDENGTINSSLGRSKVRNFTFDMVHVKVFLENGAVFSFGSIQDFQHYNTSLQADGFIELTDSKMFKPKFFGPVAGDLSTAEGKYGLFGTFKPVKYFHRMRAFITEEGYVLLRIVREENRRNHYFYTIMDPKLWFGGEKIVNMNLHVHELYITESGKMIVFSRRRETDEIIESLKNPIARRQLEHDVSRLKLTMFTKREWVVTLRDDGKLTSYDLKDPNAETRDVTSYLEELTKDEKNPSGMVVKWHNHSGYCYNFLCE